MRDVKTRTYVERLKPRTSAAMPRTAVALWRRRYIRRQQEQRRSPSEYATEQVQETASAAVCAAKRLPRKSAVQRCRQNRYQPPSAAQQRAKQHAQQQTVQRTRAAVRKAEQRLRRVGQAAVRVVRVSVATMTAATGGAVLLLLWMLPVMAAAVALSPAGVVADSHPMEPSGEAMKVWERLPDDLPLQRRTVVTYALALVDEVDYFWGGKSLTLGWDDRWGEMTAVSAEGSDTTGTAQPYGLDCSGFVDWAFYNASGSSYVIGQGGGAAEQHSACEDIDWNEVQAGDLLFYAEDEHIGIAAGYDRLGRLLVVHCAAGKGVIITHRTGFETAARPRWYDE